MKRVFLLTLLLMALLLAAFCLNASAESYYDPYSKHDHVYEEIKEKKVYPTCTDAGYRYYECSVLETDSLGNVKRCGDWKLEFINALGHKWGPWYVECYARGGECGYIRHDCEKCGAIERNKFYDNEDPQGGPFDDSTLISYPKYMTAEAFPAVNIYRTSVLGVNYRPEQVIVEVDIKNTGYYKLQNWSVEVFHESGEYLLIDEPMNYVVEVGQTAIAYVTVPFKDEDWMNGSISFICRVRGEDIYTETPFWSNEVRVTATLDEPYKELYLQAWPIGVAENPNIYLIGFSVKNNTKYDVKDIVAKSLTWLDNHYVYSLYKDIKDGGILYRNEEWSTDDGNTDTLMIFIYEDEVKQGYADRYIQFEGHKESNWSRTGGMVYSNIVHLHFEFDEMDCISVEVYAESAVDYENKEVTITLYLKNTGNALISDFMIEDVTTRFGHELVPGQVSEGMQLVYTFDENCDYHRHDYYHHYDGYIDSRFVETGYAYLKYLPQIRDSYGLWRNCEYAEVTVLFEGMVLNIDADVIGVDTKNQKIKLEITANNLSNYYPIDRYDLVVMGDGGRLFIGNFGRGGKISLPENSKKTRTIQIPYSDADAKAGYIDLDVYGYFIHHEIDEYMYSNHVPLHVVFSEEEELTLEYSLSADWAEVDTDNMTASINYSIYNGTERAWLGYTLSVSTVDGKERATKEDRKLHFDSNSTQSGTVEFAFDAADLKDGVLQVVVGAVSYNLQTKGEAENDSVQLSYKVGDIGQGEKGTADGGDAAGIEDNGDDSDEPGKPDGTRALRKPDTQAKMKVLTYLSNEKEAYGEESVTIEVTVMNTGNVDLRDVGIIAECPGFNGWSKYFSVTSLLPAKENCTVCLKFDLSYENVDADMIESISFYATAVTEGMTGSDEVRSNDVTYEFLLDEAIWVPEADEAVLAIYESMPDGTRPENGSYYVPGETIQYYVYVENNGKAAACGISVYDEDTLLGTISELGTDDGEYFPFDYTVTEEDAERGYVRRTAYARWTDADGDHEIAVTSFMPTGTEIHYAIEDADEEDLTPTGYVGDVDMDGLILTGEKAEEKEAYGSECVTLNMTVTNNTGADLKWVYTSVDTRGYLLTQLLPDGESIDFTVDMQLDAEMADNGVVYLDCGVIGYKVQEYVEENLIESNKLTFTYAIDEALAESEKSILEIYKSYDTAPQNGVFFVPGETADFHVNVYNRIEVPVYNVAVLSDGVQIALIDELLPDTNSGFIPCHYTITAEDANRGFAICTAYAIWSEDGEDRIVGTTVYAPAGLTVIEDDGDGET